MRLARANRGPLPFVEGRTVAGYSVGRLVRRRLYELVYDARGPDGRPVSLVASAEPRSDHEDRLRFRRMAALRAAIQHPALLPLLDWGEHGKTPFVVSARYPRSTLVEALPADGVPPEAALELLWPVAEALDECHAEGLVHDSLTAESVLTLHGRALLDAFGIPAAGAERAWHTRDPLEFQYGTPELARGEPLGPAANVYSLTALLVHLLTGRPPYGETPVSPSNAAWAAAQTHLTEPPPRPSEHVPSLGAGLDRVVAWGMAKQPSERPPSATALLEAAAHALGTPERAAAPRRASRRAVGVERPRVRARAPMRLTALVAVLAAVACGAIAAAVLDPFAGGGSPERAPRVDTASWEHLADRRASLRADLSAAETPIRQSVAASALAAEYDRLADSEAAGRLTPALREAASAYYALAGAGARSDAAAFSEASEAVVAAERRIASAPR